MAMPKTDRTEELLALLSAHHRLNIHPSMAKLAKDMGVSTGTASEAVSECIAKGWLKRVSHGQRGTRTNQYEITISRHMELGALTGIIDALGTYEEVLGEYLGYEISHAREVVKSRITQLVQSIADGEES